MAHFALSGWNSNLDLCHMRIGSKIFSSYYLVAFVGVLTHATLARAQNTPAGYASLPSGFTPFPAEGGYAPGTLLVKRGTGEESVLYDASTGSATTLLHLGDTASIPSAIYTRRQETAASVGAQLRIRRGIVDSAEVMAGLSDLANAELRVQRGRRYRIMGGVAAYLTFLDSLPKRTLEQALEATEGGGQLQLVTEVIEYDSAQLILSWNRKKSAGVRVALVRLFNIGASTWSMDSGSVTLTYSNPVRVGYRPWKVDVAQIRARIAARREALWRKDPTKARAEDLAIVGADVKAVLDKRVSGALESPQSVATKTVLRTDGGLFIVASRRRESSSVLGGGDAAQDAKLVSLRVASAIDSLNPERVGDGPPLNWKYAGNLATVHYYPAEGKMGWQCPSFTADLQAALTVTGSELQVDVDVPDGVVVRNGNGCTLMTLLSSVKAVRLVYPRLSAQP